MHLADKNPWGFHLKTRYVGYYICLKARALEKLQTHLFENAQKRTIYLTKRPCSKRKNAGALLVSSEKWLF